MVMLHGDAAVLLDLVGEGTVDCVITSPPYNAAMPYAGVPDAVPLSEHSVRIREWAEQLAAVLKWGGRLWLNVPPTLPVNHTRWSPQVEWHLALELAGLNYHDKVVWWQNTPDQPTAWGSWMNPNAPNLRGRYEEILVFHRGMWPRWDNEPSYDVKLDGVTETEWTSWVTNVWEIPPAKRIRGGHPCPFPHELVRRCLLMSTRPGDLVMDPFAGSGTTLLVAEKYGRRAIGVDLSLEYVESFNREGVQS